MSIRSHLQSLQTYLIVRCSRSFPYLPCLSFNGEMLYLQYLSFNGGIPHVPSVVRWSYLILTGPGFRWSIYTRHYSVCYCPLRKPASTTFCILTRRAIETRRMKPPTSTRTQAFPDDTRLTCPPYRRMADLIHTDIVGWIYVSLDLHLAGQLPFGVHGKAARSHHRRWKSKEIRALHVE